MIRLGRRRPHRDLVQGGLQESAISLAMRWLEIISIGDRPRCGEFALGRFELDRSATASPMRTAPVTHSLDADDLFVGLVVAAGRLSNRGGVATDRTARRRAGRPHRIRRCAGIDLVADVLDDHSLVAACQSARGSGGRGGKRAEAGGEGEVIEREVLASDRGCTLRLAAPPDARRERALIVPEKSSSIVDESNQ
jgi:hypothetical protein